MRATRADIAARGFRLASNTEPPHHRQPRSVRRKTTSVKIYVAGWSAEHELASHFIERLRSAGHEITHDWTEDVRRARADGHETDRTLTPVQRATCATADLDAVVRCDMFWQLVSPRGIGQWVELGAALALDKQVVVSGAFGSSIFCELAETRFDSHEEALSWLLA